MNFKDTIVSFSYQVLGDLRGKVSRGRSGQRVPLFNQLKQGLLPGKS